MALQRLDHLLVLTDDVDATAAFYCDALGFEPGDRPPLEFPGRWLYLDDRPCLHVAERASYEAWVETLGLDVDAAPVDHIAFSADDYAALAARLERAGVEAVPNTVPGVLRQLFVTDPNGVRIELNVPAA